MAYRHLDTSTRVEIVKQYWGGRRIADLARDYSVDRDSIHLWIRRAERSLQEALGPSKPGPKQDPVQLLQNRANELEKMNTQLMN